MTTELLAASYMLCGHSLCMSRFIELYRAMACCRTRWLSVGHLRTRHQPTKVRCGPGEEHISENRSHSSTLPTVWLAKMAEASNQVTDIVTLCATEYTQVHPTSRTAPYLPNVHDEAHREEGERHGKGVIQRVVAPHTSRPPYVPIYRKNPSIS